MAAYQQPSAWRSVNVEESESSGENKRQRSNGDSQPACGYRKIRRNHHGNSAQHQRNRKAWRRKHGERSGGIWRRRQQHVKRGWYRDVSGSIIVMAAKHRSGCWHQRISIISEKKKKKK